MSDEAQLTARDREWLAHIRACGEGSLAAYAREQEIDTQRLYAARSRLKSKGFLGGVRRRLVRVQREAPSQPPVMEAGYCRVHLRNGVVLEVALRDGEWPSVLASAAALP